MLKRTHSSVPVFDIRVTPESSRNVVLIKGAPEEASSVRLVGNVVVSALDASSIKKISVRLVGTMRLRWTEVVTVPRMAPINKPIRFDKIIFERELSASDSLPKSRASPSNPSSGRATPSGSMSNLASYFASHGLGGHGNHGNHGNHASSLGPDVNTTSLHTAVPGHGLVQGPSVMQNQHAGGIGSISAPSLNRIQSAINLSHHSSQPSFTVGSPETAATVGVPRPVGSNIEYPFEIVVPGSIAESIEGNANAQIVFWLTATAERGRFQSSLSSRKHVRIVRTLGVDTYDIAHTVSIENVWPNKVEYTIDVPSKAIAIGSTVMIRFHLMSLSKGLSIGKVRAQILESLHLAIPATPVHSSERVVVEESYDSDDLVKEAEEWEFSRRLTLPKSLSKSTPDTVIQPHVKVSHKLKLFVTLINRDGHSSELRASLPVHLFISPHVPVSSQDISTASFHGVGPPGPEEQLFSTETARDNSTEEAIRDDSTAPPNYREHVYDQLWSEVGTPIHSPSPGASGTTTPFWTSPRGSLLDLDASQQAQLNAGLRALAQSRDASNVTSRSNSTVDIEALSRVPSYDRALQDGVDQDEAPNYS